MTRLVRIAAPSLLLLLSWRAEAAAEDNPAAPSDPPASSVERLHLPTLTQVRMDNGLTVVLEEDHRAPFVAMRLAYDAGSRDDPPGREGLATLTQRMATMATKHVARGMYDHWLDKIGASDRGWLTLPDSTSEWATVPANAVPVMLWLWSDQMGFFSPAVDQKLLDDARETSKIERQEKIENAGYGGVREILLRALYPAGHPYRALPVAGSVGEASVEEVQAFRDRLYVPNAATLVLSGDFRSADVMAQIRTYFGPIASAPIATPPLFPARLEKAVRLDVAASVKAPMVLMNWRTPAYFDAGDAELDIVARTLAGIRVSTLHWALVDRSRVALQVHADQLSRALGSDFQIRAVVAPGHTPEEVITEIDKVLTQTVRSPMSEESFRNARDTVIIPRLSELDRATRRAALYATYVRLKHDSGWLSHDIARYEAASAISVQSAVLRWLNPRYRVVTVVTPDASAPASGVLRATTGGAP